MNDRIRAREVRVIDDEGQQLGIMPPHEAIRKAREKNLDLVEISPTAQPPVCRIMDYGKFLYQQEKKEREAKKHQKTITVKEVKFRINVDDHDYETKKNHVLRFLGEGDKVKATIFFRGREMTRTSLGRQILERLIKDVEPDKHRGVPSSARGQHAARDPGAEEVGQGTRKGEAEGRGRAKRVRARALLLRRRRSPSPRRNRRRRRITSSSQGAAALDIEPLGKMPVRLFVLANC